MINLTRARLGLIAVLLLSVRICSAQAPSGLVSFTFDKSAVPVIDLSGDFSPTNVTIIGAGGQPVAFNGPIGLTHDGNGKLRGTGTSLVSIGEDDFLAANYNANGMVSGGGNAPIRVTLSVRYSGSGTIAGRETPFNVTVKYRLNFNPETGALEGTTQGKAQFSKIGGGSVRSDVGVALGDTAGSWTADLTLAALNKLGGTGVLTFSTGRGITGNLTGTFSPRSNVSKVKFTGNDATSRGSNPTFTISPADTNAFEVVNLRGKVLGQVVRQ